MFEEFFKGECTHFLYGDIKNIQKAERCYIMEVYTTEDPKERWEILVSCLCPDLAELVQKTGEEDVVAKDVSFMVLDYEKFKGYENKGFATCAKML